MKTLFFRLLFIFTINSLLTPQKAQSDVLHISNTCLSAKALSSVTLPSRPKTIIFIHDMFQNVKCWTPWINYFTAKGYICIAESWPHHSGEPGALRATAPSGLDTLGLEDVYHKYETIAGNYPDAIIIGHSVGGLIAQKLVNNGFGSMAICINSLAPNRMLNTDIIFFRENSSVLAGGDKIYNLSPEAFHDHMGNAMLNGESGLAYESTVLPESRKVIRDCMLKPGEIDFQKTRKPLLFIAAKNDRLIPYALNKRNAEAYSGMADYKEFENRGHFITQENWEEVAIFIREWIELHNVLK